MTLTSSQKNSLLISYYKTFPNAIRKKIFTSGIYKQSELLAVCLAHYLGMYKPYDEDVTFKLKFNTDALFNVTVSCIDVSNMERLRSELSNIGENAAEKWVSATFDEYVSDIRTFTSSLEKNGYFSFEEFTEFLVVNKTVKYEASIDELDYESAEFGFIGEATSSSCDENAGPFVEQQLALYQSEQASNRLSTINVSELIKCGDSDVHELLNNLAWLVKAKHDVDGTIQDKTPIQIGEELFLTAASGCIGFTNHFAQAFGVPAFNVRFPAQCTLLRTQLMEQVFERTAETGTGSLRGPSKNWFAIAEHSFKQKLVIERDTQELLKQLLVKKEDHSIGLGVGVICDLQNWAEEQNITHRFFADNDLLFKQFVEQNQTEPSTPYLLAKQVKQALHEKVIGQSLAVENVSAHLSSLLVNGGSQHLGVSTFFGASGTGKTYLAEAIVEVFTDTLELDYQVNILNMEQYSDSKDVLKLFGSGSQFVDSALGDLTLSVMKQPRSIIVFDEIEKAHPEVVQSLLTLIDKGYAVDQTSNRKVDFSLCYFVFTTNIGSGELTGDKGAIDFDPLELLTRKKTSTDRVLSPEMANRLAAGNIAVFKPFKAKDLVTIAHQAAYGSSERKVQWPVSITAEIILATLGGAVSPRTIAKQIEKLEGKIIDKLIDEVPQYQLAALNNIRFADKPIMNDVVPAIQVVSSLPFVNNFVSDQVSVSQKTDLASIEVALKSNADAILIDESNLVADISSLADLINQYGEKAVFTCTFDAEPSKLKHFNSGYLLQKHYGHTRKAGIETFNHIFSIVQYHAQLIKHTATALGRNASVNLELAHKLTNNGVEVSFKSLTQKQRVRAEDADLHFLDFAGKPEGSLEDVIGLDGVKKRLKLIVKAMGEEQSAHTKQIEIPKGYLFTGLPGTGKTHLARSLAAESDMFFFAVNAANLLVGNVVKNINDLFAVARRYQPSTIFLDEIDSIAKSRNSSGSNAIAVNALLTAMDGFDKDDSKIFVLAATNNPNQLDSALTRAGRFDRTVPFNPPCKQARAACVQQWFDNKESKLDAELKDELVAMLEGATIGRINEIFNNSVLSSLADDYEWQPQLLIEAIRSAKLGCISQSLKQSKEQIANIAYHEAGHLVAHKLLLPDVPVEFASIQPRGAALGMVVPGQADNEPVLSKQRVKAYLQVFLAGIVAEQMRGMTGDAQTIGGSDDRRKATNLAKKAIVDWGMSEQFGLAIPSELTIDTAQVNREINVWLLSAYKDVYELLTNNKSLLNRASQALLEKEQLDKSDIEGLFAISQGVHPTKTAA
ncbi:AAA family ATPase [Pseudoalteromonas gelatinilytica]